MRSIIQILFIVCFINGELYSQNYNASPSVHFPTPASVWSFKKFGEVPVNEYRGLANISVPIYNISLDDVNIPLELNYYSGGIKVSEEASMVGLGWSFNIPTVIQEIKDKVDYQTSTTHFKLPPYQGNPYYPNVGVWSCPFYPYWNTQTNQFYNVGAVDNLPFLTNVSNKAIIDHNGYYNLNGKYTEMFEPTTRIIDTEPDIFSINLNGVEIKFCREQSNYQTLHNNGLEILPFRIINGRNEYKVEQILNNVTLSTYEVMALGGIKITDPSSNKYFFQKIEKVNAGGGITTLIYKITKIVTASNQEILFNYGSLTNISEAPKIKTKYAKRLSPTSIGSNHSTCGEVYTSVGLNGSLYCGSFSSSLNDAYCVSFETVTQTCYYLQSIQTPNEIITFTNGNRLDNTTMKKLEKVEVKNSFNRTIKKVLFNYDYFVSNDNITKRLKLLSVLEEGEEPYQFEYNSTELPKNNSYSIDYWGFYNGHNNSNLKPDLTDLGYPTYTENSANDFNSNLDFAKACTLEKIIYPTKGYTIFDYELHLFDNLLYNTGGNTPIINSGAGLRIANVIDYNHDGQIAKHTNYQYIGGKAISKRVLVKATSVKEFYDYEYNTHTTQILISTINNFVNNSPNAEGAYIGYDKVITRSIGSYNNGRIEKTYTNNENSCINPSNIFSYDAISYSNTNNFENGKVLNEKIYDSNNTILLDKVNQYENVIFNQGFYGMSKQGNGTAINDYVNNGQYNYYYYPRTLCIFYPIKGKITRLKSKTVTEYFPTGSSATKDEYFFDNKNNIIELKTTLLPNTVLSRKLKTMTHSVNTSHLNKNLLNQIFYEQDIINQNVREAREYIYEESSGVTRLKELKILPKANPDPLQVVKIIYDLYDDKHNVIQFHRENQSNTCIIWGYNKSLPIAKIENCDYASLDANLIASIQSESNTGTEAVLINKLNQLRDSLPNSFVTTFTHIPLVGVSTITDSKADKVTYQYDLTGKLIKVFDKEGNTISENQYHYIPQN